MGQNIPHVNIIPFNEEIQLSIIQKLEKYILCILSKLLLNISNSKCKILSN